jgi:polyisoprenoid-binding protein YceI
MKKYFKGSLVVIAISLAALGNIAFAQSNYKIEETKDVDMKLRGTSTLHNWEMDARTVEGEAQFDVTPENKLISLKSLSFALEVKDLKSDNKGLDKNAYKALKSDEHKDIHYKLTSAEMSPEKDGKYLLKAHGKLSIAGVTKENDMNVYCVINKDGTITCTGSDKLNMTDYKVKPPTFLMGAMKTGDAITLDFVVVYKKQKGV